MTISKAYGLLEYHGNVTRISGKEMMIATIVNTETVSQRLQKLSPLASSLVQQ
jgi:DNA-binding transcriptional regulator YhcF (GntR family)